MSTRRSVRLRTITSLALVLAAAATVSLVSAAQVRQPLIVVAELADAIHPITAEFVVESIAQAEQRHADLFVLQLDTPGGLDQAMRDIIQAFLNSPVPVCLYVGPQGARAASAGFFMAMAADVVVMAPRTNMGAASPVAVGGGADETMQRKLIHDAEAYIRSLAHGQDRPADAAAEAVTEGRSFSAEESVELGLADLIADNLDAAIAAIDGRQLTKSGRELTLSLANAEVQSLELSTRQRILAALANPTVAYMLLLIGLAGLYFELSTPGAILPGVLGGICLVVALLAFQILPISFAGLALIGLAMLFFILEVKVTSYGLLTVAGLVSFVLGSLMLVPGPIPEMRLHASVVVPTALGIAAIAGFLLRLVLRAHRAQVTTGAAGLVGRIGEAISDFGAGSDGRVFVHGEIWRARSDLPVRTGHAVEVLSIENGMTVRVRPRAEKGS